MSKNLKLRRRRAISSGSSTPRNPTPTVLPIRDLHSHHELPVDPVGAVGSSNNTQTPPPMEVVDEEVAVLYSHIEHPTNSQETGPRSAGEIILIDVETNSEADDDMMRAMENSNRQERGPTGKPWAIGRNYFVDFRKHFNIPNLPTAKEYCDSCIDKPVNTCFVGCWHMVYCDSCVKEFVKSHSKCPLCRNGEDLPSDVGLEFLHLM